MVCGGDERGGVRDARPDVVQGRVSIEGLELVGLVARSVVRYPVPADGELVEAQHVHDAHLRYGNPEELRTLVHHRAHQQTAVRSALNRQPRRRGVLLVDEPLGRGDKVVEDVLLLELHPLLVPLFAVFATATDIRRRVNEALLENREAGGAERRRLHDVEATVRIKERGIVPVELEPLAMDEKHWNPCTVLARIEHLRRLERIVAIAGDLRPTEDGAPARRDVVAVDRGGHVQRVEGVEHEWRVVGAAEPARAAGPWQRYLVLERAVQPVDVRTGHHVLQVGGKQLSTCCGDGVEGFELLRKNVSPVRLLRMRGIDENHSPIRRFPVRPKEQLVANVVDDVIRIVVDDRDNRPERGLALRQVADVQSVAVLPFSAFRNREDREPFVLGRLDDVETLGIRRVLIDQNVLGLRSAHLVEIHLVVFVYRRLLLTR